MLPLPLPLPLRAPLLPFENHLHDRHDLSVLLLVLERDEHNRRRR
jgi:hypothetical protein